MIFLDVHCNAGKAEPILPGKAHSEGTRLGQAVIYSCPHGYNINGTNKLICRANGNLKHILYLYIYFRILYP